MNTNTIFGNDVESGAATGFQQGGQDFLGAKEKGSKLIKKGTKLQKQEQNSKK